MGTRITIMAIVMAKTMRRDDSKPAPVEQPVDHESDAVYVTAADFMVTTSDRISIEDWFVRCCRNSMKTIFQGFGHRRGSIVHHS